MHGVNPRRRRGRAHSSRPNPSANPVGGRGRRVSSLPPARMVAARSGRRSCVALALPAPATAAHGRAVGRRARRSRSRRRRQTSKKVVEAYNKLNEELKATRAAASAGIAAVGAAAEARLADAEPESARSPSSRTRPASWRSVGAARRRATAFLSTGWSRSTSWPGTGRPQIDAFTATRDSLTAENAKLDAALRQAGRRRPSELAARKKKIEADLDKLYEMREQAYGVGHVVRVVVQRERSRRCPARPASRCGTRTARSARRTSGRPRARTGTTAPG